MSDSAKGPATTYEVRGGIATVTLNRPENRNALSNELVSSLSENIDRAVNDDSARVVVITGAGTVFCAGADLKERKTVSQGSSPDSPPKFVSVFQQIQGAPKPVVAKLNGSALAGGLGLCCSCDISVAPTTAMFGFTEVRIGVAPAIISIVCLPKLRHADAAELFLTGERIPAVEAQRVGLINRAVAPEDVDRVTDELVAKLLLGGPLALAATKRLLRDVPQYASQEQAYLDMTRLSGQLFGSEEGIEGMTAFAEKRTPRWVP